MKLLHCYFAALVACLLVCASSAANPAYPEHFKLLDRTKQHTIWRHVLAAVGPKGVLGFGTKNATLLAPTDKAFRGPDGLFVKLGVSEAIFKTDMALMTLLLRYNTFPLVSLTKLLKAAAASSGQANPDTDWWIPTLVDWNFASNLNGQKMPNSVRMFTRRGRIVFRGAASVSPATLISNNTDLFVLNSVLLPRINRFRGCKSPTEVLASRKTFVHLTSALKQAALYNIVARSAWDGTFFAPTDAAFRAYAKDAGTTVGVLLRDRKAMERLLQYHASPDRIYISNMQHGERIRTYLNKSTLTVDLETTKGKVILEAAWSASTVSNLDIFTCKAVIHPVDSVLVPPNA